LLLLLSLASLYIIQRGTLADVNWSRYEPAWWLIRQTSNKDANTRDQALAELIRRIDNQSLKPRQIDRLVEMGLEYQRRTDLPWIPAWGLIVEQSRAGRHVSDEQWQQYVLQAANFSFAVRPDIRRGDPLVASLDVLVPRLGSADFELNIPSEPPIKLQSRFKSDAESSEIFTDSKETMSIYLQRQTGPSGWNRVDWDDALWAPLRDGPQLASCSFEVQIYLPSYPRQEKKLLAKKQVKLSAPFMLHAADHQTVSLISDPRWREPMKTWITSVTCPGLYWDKQSMTLNPGWLASPPLDGSFEIYVKTSRREYKGSEIDVYAGKDPVTAITWSMPVFDSDEHADVILRPSVHSAVGTLDMTQIWGEELVLHNVPVSRMAWAPSLSSSATTQADQATSP